MRRITPLDIERFTCGDCAILARELQRLTGWRFAAFTSDHFEGPDIHAFVIDPEGFCVDIEGRHHPEAFIASWGSQWGATGIIETTYERCHELWEKSRTPDYGNYSIRRARQLAQFLLDTLYTREVTSQP